MNRRRIVTPLYAAVALVVLAPGTALAASPTGTLASTGSEFPIGLGVAGAILILAGIAAFVITRVRGRRE